MKTKMIEITEGEATLIVNVFKSYYCVGTDELMSDNKRIESLFKKIDTLFTDEDDQGDEQARGMERWIPTAEARPEELEEVIVTWVNHDPVSYYEDIKDKPDTAFAVRYHDTWFWWNSTIVDFLDEYGWLESIEQTAISDTIEITAWMRRPEPYKGEDE